MRKVAYSEHSIAIHSISKAGYITTVLAIVCTELRAWEASSFCDFKTDLCDFTLFYSFFFYSIKRLFFDLMCLLRSTWANLCPIMIYFNALDVNICCSEEVMFLLMLSVAKHWLNALMIMSEADKTFYLKFWKSSGDRRKSLFLLELWQYCQPSWKGVSFEIQCLSSSQRWNKLNYTYSLLKDCSFLCILTYNKTSGKNCNDWTLSCQQNFGRKLKWTNIICVQISYWT